MKKTFTPEPPTEFTEFASYGGMLLTDKTDNILIHLAQSILRTHIYATQRSIALDEMHKAKLVKAQQAIQELETILRNTQEETDGDNK